jgi:LysM repeat protein
MKILQIFGAVVAVHLLAFIFIFASPGCQSSPRNVPTPDATVPTAGNSAPPVSYSPPVETVSTAESLPAGDAGTTTFTPEMAPGRATPTRPGSPNAAAVVPAKPMAENVAPVTTYTVQKGDSLWSIAKKNHLGVGELAKANSLGAGVTLQPGKKLIIPGKVMAAAPAADLSTMPAPSKTPAALADKPGAAVRPAGIDTVKHVVQPGETLGAIARKYQVKFGELAAANGITDPAKIRVGQELIIPGFKAVSGKSAGTPAKTPAKASATAAADKPAAPADNAANNPHFEIKAPPPGQDLDSGLKGNTATDVPTIKVDDVKTDDTPRK